METAERSRVKEEFITLYPLFQGILVAMAREDHAKWVFFNDGAKISQDFGKVREVLPNLLDKYNLKDGGVIRAFTPQPGSTDLPKVGKMFTISNHSKLTYRDENDFKLIRIAPDTANLPVVGPIEFYQELVAACFD